MKGGQDLPTIPPDSKGSVRGKREKGGEAQLYVLGRRAATSMFVGHRKRTYALALKGRFRLKEWERRRKRMKGLWDFPLDQSIVGSGACGRVQLSWVNFVSN